MVAPVGERSATAVSSPAKALKPDGAFIGAMLGGTTLTELRRCILLAEQEREVSSTGPWPKQVKRYRRRRGMTKKRETGGGGVRGGLGLAFSARERQGGKAGRFEGEASEEDGGNHSG